MKPRACPRRASGSAPTAGNEGRGDGEHPWLSCSAFHPLLLQLPFPAEHRAGAIACPRAGAATARPGPASPGHLLREGPARSPPQRAPPRTGWAKIIIIFFLKNNSNFNSRLSAFLAAPAMPPRKDGASGSDLPASLAGAAGRAGGRRGKPAPGSSPNSELGLSWERKHKAGG